MIRQILVAAIVIVCACGLCGCFLLPPKAVSKNTSQEKQRFFALRRIAELRSYEPMYAAMQKKDVAFVEKHWREYGHGLETEPIYREALAKFFEQHQAWPDLGRHPRSTIHPEPRSACGIAGFLLVQGKEQRVGRPDQG